MRNSYPFLFAENVYFMYLQCIYNVFARFVLVHVINRISNELISIPYYYETHCEFYIEKIKHVRITCFIKYRMK